MFKRFAIGFSNFSCFPPYLQVVVVGDSGVGKTCLCSRLIGKGFTSSSAPTIGAVFQRTSVQINGTTVDLDVWDTGMLKCYIPIRLQITNNAIDSNPQRDKRDTER